MFTSIEGIDQFYTYVANRCGLDKALICESVLLHHVNIKHKEHKVLKQNMHIFKNVRLLDLSGTKIKNLSFLKNSKIHTLDLSICEGITDDSVKFIGLFTLLF
jgi:hypothetical protein